jgi:uncharacterized protein YecE (DUF72 family)
MVGKILAGTASWTDPSFVADWYPPDVRAADRLRWYAEHFSLVEVNSTFYRIPEARTCQAWCDQTPQGFIFDVKLHRLLSRHSTKADLLPPDLRSKAILNQRRVELSPQLEREVAKRFLRGIAPLQDAGKLGALLLQLSPAFRPRTNSLTELDFLLELLEKHTLAIELRNRDWVAGEHFSETKKFFARRRLVFVMVDAPEDSHFTVMPSHDVVTNPRLAYLRAHGRNASAYVRGRTVAERFNYDYPPAELKQIARRAVAAATKARQVQVIYNNNASDYAPKAATGFQKILHQQYPQTLPAEVDKKEMAYA